jgi:hypothetical protein
MADDEHWYSNPWNPAELLPSVTTILGAVAAKPALAPWSAHEAARFAVENHELIGEMLAAGDVEGARKRIAAEPRRISGEAADLGSVLHRVAEAEVKNQPISLTDEEAFAVEPYLDSLHRFVDEMEPEYLWAEATVYHQWQRYAGTTDGGMRFHRRSIPIITEAGELVDMLEAGMLLNGDYKSGRKVWLEAVAQHIGYSTATHMGLKDATNTIVRMPRVDGAVVVHIRPGGYRVHGVRITPAGRAAWEHAVGWFHWLRHVAPTDLGIGIHADGLHVDDLPGLDVRVRNGLALAGVRTLAELEVLGEAGFRSIKYAGPVAVETARKLLALEGRTWTAEIERGAA